MQTIIKYNSMQPTHTQVYTYNSDIAIRKSKLKARAQRKKKCIDAKKKKKKLRTWCIGIHIDAHIC